MGQSRFVRLIVHEMTEAGGPHENQAYDLKSVEIKRARGALRGESKALTDRAFLGSEINVSNRLEIVKKTWPNEHRLRSHPDGRERKTATCLFKEISA